MGAALEDDPRIGQMVANKYRLESLLGEGGVGMVYRAENVLLGRTVAIKLLRPEYARNKDLVNRFIREARAANLVRHVNVVDVLDVGLDESNVPYIVQELLHGEDLSHYLYQHGPLTPDVAIPLLLPVVDAVAFAHVMGVVHRDLKPENIFITQSEGIVLPKVLDFGISKMGMPGESVRITSTGISMGTPAYMSPEQIQRFGEIDARADVWALGVILYEMVSGQLPFEADTPGALFVEICTKEPVSLAARVPDLDEDFERAVMRCLRREVSERYPTAAEFARDLRHLRDGNSIEPTQRIALVSMVPSPIEPPGNDAAARRTTGQEGRQPTTDRRMTGGDRKSTLNERKSTGNARMPSRPSRPGVEARPTTGMRGRPDPGTLDDIEPDSVGPIEADPRLQTPAPFEDAPRSRRGLWLGLGGLLLVGGGLVAFATLRNGSAGARHDTAANNPPPPAQSHSLVIESTPPGASIAEDGRVLGTTPLTISLERQTPRQFVVSLPGYVPYVIHQDHADRDVQVVAALVPSAVPTVPTGVDTNGSAPPPVVPTPNVAVHPNANDGARRPHGRPGNRGAHTATPPVADAPPPPTPTPTPPPLGIRMER